MTPAPQWYKGCLCSIKTQEIADPCKSCLYRYHGDPIAQWKVPPQPLGPILDLIKGGCWARCQLRRGIKDVSVASRLWKSLTLVRVVFMDTLAIPEHNDRFLYNHHSESGSVCGRLLGTTPATQRYKLCPEATILHGAIGFQERGGGLDRGGQV